MQSGLSPAHMINEPQQGWIDVAGGKLTTYRLMAEQTVDRVVDFTGVDAKPCETANIPLLHPSSFILHPSYSSILPPPVSREVVEHFVRNEWAACLNDVMIR